MAAHALAWRDGPVEQLYSPRVVVTNPRANTGAVRGKPGCWTARASGSGCATPASKNSRNQTRRAACAQHNAQNKRSEANLGPALPGTHDPARTRIHAFQRTGLQISGSGTAKRSLTTKAFVSLKNRLPDQAILARLPFQIIAEVRMRNSDQRARSFRH